MSALRDAGAIVVAPLQDVSTAVLDATGAARVIPATWLQAFPEDGLESEPEGLERYDAVLRRLRQQLRQEEVRLDRGEEAGDLAGRNDGATDQRSNGQSARDRWFEDLEQDRGISGLLGDSLRSLREAFNLDFSFGEPPRDDFAAASPVPEDSTLILAQAPAPGNDTTAWTLVTAPTAGLLSTSMAALSAPQDWTRIGGRITAYSLDDNTIQTVPVGNVSYLATLPFSFTNFRLIAANWFSINNGFYALALLAAAILLGFITWLLVRPLGRKN